MIGEKCYKEEKYYSITQINIISICIISDWFYMYGDTYKGIRQCNTFIRQSETAAIDPSEKNSVVAEARFIRAFHYFNLVSVWEGYL